MYVPGVLGALGGQATSPAEAAQWVAPRTGFADSRSVCRTERERTGAESGSAGVRLFPHPHSPASPPIWEASSLTQAVGIKPPLMDVSREVVGPREEQDVGGRVW